MPNMFIIYLPWMCRQGPIRGFGLPPLPWLVLLMNPFRSVHFSTNTGQRAPFPGVTPSSRRDSLEKPLGAGLSEEIVLK